jgi:UDP-N-acetylglucosamine 2-epimerase (hydrolysing)
MHLQEEYGYTLLEIERCQFKMFIRLKIIEATMDLTLAKTIEGLSSYSKKINPDLIVVHGDRDAMVLL